MLRRDTVIRAEQVGEVVIWTHIKYVTNFNEMRNDEYYNSIWRPMSKINAKKLRV